jgi:1-deoxy-D-xylulose-5-phosphate reductoisomerase
VIPIDSEHSAIFQSLAGEMSPVRRLLLTASGGPFLRTPWEKLHGVTVEQALCHPNWKMGAKITVDSATMVNKGFEVIEAHWLFGLPAERIDVLVHPQSVVHSMVEFCDGAIKAQLGTPDMRVPIQYALTFPARMDYDGTRFDFSTACNFTFEPVDTAKFPALDIAYDCLRRGGTAPCVMNAANEIAVEAFLNGRIGYTDIVKVIERTLASAGFAPNPGIDDLALCNAEARKEAGCLITNY